MSRVAKMKANERQFFYYWIMLTDPLKKIPLMQRNVLAEFLYHRYLLADKVSDADLLDTLTFEYETKGKICQVLGISRPRLAIEMTKMRKNNLIIGKKLNPIRVPDFSPGDKQFTISYEIHIDGARDDTTESDSSDEDNSKAE